LRYAIEPLRSAPRGRSSAYSLLSTRSWSATSRSASTLVLLRVRSVCFACDQSARVRSVCFTCDQFASRATSSTATCRAVITDSPAATCRAVITIRRPRTCRAVITDSPAATCRAVITIRRPRTCRTVITNSPNSKGRAVITNPPTANMSRGDHKFTKQQRVARRSRHRLQRLAR